MKRIRSKIESHQNRRGIAVLWLILWGGVFLTFFCVVLEIATMWQTQVELNNTLDAAALAAVKEWGASGSTLTETPRNSGVAYAAANPVLGAPVVLTTNYDPDVLALPNQNDLCDGNLVFGRINYPVAFPVTFNTSLGGAINLAPAVRAQTTVPVQGFCTALFGITPFFVSASSTAYYDPLTGEAALVSITTFTCL